MAFASTAMAGPEIRIPNLPRPRLRWPRPSQRTRALLMMAVMVSPSFLCDRIGYGIQRLFYTPDQIAALRAPDLTLARFRIFPIACLDNKAAAAEQQHASAYAAQQRWPRYPEAGPGCFTPDRNMRGAPGLIGFSVACPTMVLSALEQRRWVAYAADRGWPAYPAAGAGCVDP